MNITEIKVDDYDYPEGRYPGSRIKSPSDTHAALTPEWPGRGQGLYKHDYAETNS